MAKTVNNSRKCPKCGTELGQKNLCPVCSRLPQTTEKVEASTGNSDKGAAASKKVSAPVAEKLELFVKEHPFSWNSKFDVFYDSLLNTEKCDGVDYRTAVEICRRWDCIFAAIRGMLDNKSEITADLMIKIMDEIPQKFPEIEEMKARELAKDYFQSAPSTDQFSILFMPEDGILSQFYRKDYYESRDIVFSYYPHDKSIPSKGKSSNLKGIHSPFDCIIWLLPTQEMQKMRQKMVKKGSPIAVLRRTELPSSAVTKGKCKK